MVGMVDRVSIAHHEMKFTARLTSCLCHALHKLPLLSAAHIFCWSVCSKPLQFSTWNAICCKSSIILSMFLLAKFFFL